MKKKSYQANRVSGIAASAFLLSIVAEFVKQHNERGRFILPFYAMTLDTKKHKADEWVSDDKYEAACDELLAHIRRYGYSYFTALRSTMRREVAVFRKNTYQLIQILPTLADRKLPQLYDGFIQICLRLYGLGVVTFLYEDILSKRLAASLASRHNDIGSVLPFIVKTDYKSFMVAAEELLYKIKKERAPTNRQRLVNRFLRDFFFIRANFIYSPVLDKLAVTAEANALPARMVAVPRETSARDFSLTKNERTIIKLLKISEAIRDQRKIASQVGAYGLSRFWDEARRRLGIKNSVMERLFWFEYPKLFQQPQRIVNQAKKRHLVSFVVDGRRNYYLNYAAVKQGRAENKKVTEVKGTPAAPGVVRGRAQIVLGPQAFFKFKKGSILITEMTRPDFLPIMRQAKAIITDEGGLTCHAAIMSRELGIPCIIGTRIATQVFKDGDRVEVDAEKGVARKL